MNLQQRFAAARKTKIAAEVVTLGFQLKSMKALGWAEGDFDDFRWAIIWNVSTDETIATTLAMVKEQKMEKLWRELKKEEPPEDMKDSLEMVFGDLDLDEGVSLTELTKELWYEQVADEPLLELCPWTDGVIDPMTAEAKVIEVILKSGRTKEVFCLKVRRRILKEAKKYDWKTARQAHWLRIVERRTLTDDDVADLSLYFTKPVKLTKKKEPEEQVPKKRAAKQ